MAGGVAACDFECRGGDVGGENFGVRQFTGERDGKAARTGNAAANLEMTYALTIVKQHGTWYVQSIAPSTQAGGQP